VRGVFCIRRRGVGSWGTGFVEPKNNAPIMEALLYHYILGRGVGSVMLGVGHGRRFFRGTAASFWGLGNSFFILFYKSASSGGFESSHPSHPPPLQPQRTTPPPSPPHSSPPNQHAHTHTPPRRTLIMPIAAITPTTSSNARSHCPCSADSHFLSFPWVLPGFLFLKTSERYG